MEQFEVTNFDKFQHYKDRTMTFIKLHLCLFDDYEFECLSDAEKGQLILIWLYAPKVENVFPCDPAWVARKIGVTGPINLDKFFRLKFLNKINTVAKPYQSDTEKPKSARPDIDIELDIDKDSSSFTCVKEGRAKPDLYKILREQYIPIFGPRIMSVVGQVLKNKRAAKIKKLPNAILDALDEMKPLPHPDDIGLFVQVLSGKVYKPSEQEQKTRHSQPVQLGDILK